MLTTIQNKKEFQWKIDNYWKIYNGSPDHLLTLW